MDDLREILDQLGVRDRRAHGAVRRVAMGHPRLGHDELEQLLDRVLVRLHRLPVLQLIQEDVVRMQLDRRLADGRVHRDLVRDVVEREVPRPTQRDLTELAAAAAPAHDLVHRVHRRPKDLRDLVHGGRGGVREAHHGRRVAPGDAIEDLGHEVVHFAVDDVIDPEGRLHVGPVVEVPGAGPAQDNLVLASGPPDVLRELEEFCLRIRREHAAHREGHAHGPEAERIHRVQADDLRVVRDVSVDVVRGRDDDLVPAMHAGERRLDLPEPVRHADRAAFGVQLGRVREDPEDEPRVPVVRRDATEERGEGHVPVVRHQRVVGGEHVLCHRSPTLGP